MKQGEEKDTIINKKKKKNIKSIVCNNLIRKKKKKISYNITRSMRHAVGETLLLFLHLYFIMSRDTNHAWHSLVFSSLFK